MRKIISISLITALGFTYSATYAIDFYSMFQKSDQQDKAYTEIKEDIVKAVIPTNMIEHVKQIQEEINKNIIGISQRQKEDTNMEGEGEQEGEADNTSPTMLPIISKYNDILDTLNITLVKSNDFKVDINLPAKDYYIGIYFKTVNLTKITGIKINIVENNTNKTIQIPSNITIEPGSNSMFVLRPGNLDIYTDGKLIFNRPLNIEGTISSIDITSTAKLVYNDMKIEYIGDDLVEEKNKGLLTSSLSNDNITKEEENIITLPFSSIQQTVKKNIVWDKQEGKFIIDNKVINQTITNINLDPTLKERLKDGYNIYTLLINDNIKKAFSGLTFVTDSIDFDKNPDTTEIVYKDEDGNYYIYQIVIQKNDKQNTNTYNVNIKLLYEGKEDITVAKNIEIDGDDTTKEWVIEKPTYTAILQYKNGSMRRVLYAPYTKIYINNPLEFEGKKWKVLLGLTLDTTVKDGKYYVQPQLKIYWFDDNKQKYYIKQLEDYSKYKDLTLKINDKIVYKKNDGVVDYSNTDYVPAE